MWTSIERTAIHVRLGNLFGSSYESDWRFKIAPIISIYKADYIIDILDAAKKEYGRWFEHRSNKTLFDVMVMIKRCCPGTIPIDFLLECESVIVKGNAIFFIHSK